MFNELNKTKIKADKTSGLKAEVLNFQRDLASIFNKQQSKRIAPPPPALTNFDQRINSLRDLGRRRGKRYSKIGIISSIIIVLVVGFLSWLMIRELININNRIDERQEMFNQVMAEREVDCSSDCCQESLKIIRQNNYIKANLQGKCPDGYTANGLRCEGSLTWCQQSQP
jgi:hypothetical protein